MMIMEDSKLSKIEYDLKTIMYSVYDIPHRLCNISGSYRCKIQSRPIYFPMSNQN